MEGRVDQVVKEFIKRLHKAYPGARVEINDYKWSTEDASLDVYIPVDLTEEEEDKFLDTRTKLAGDLFDSTGVYILALARSSDTADV